jgi:hypothetical protein
MARDAIDSLSSYLAPETLKHCHGLTVRAKNNISLFLSKNIFKLHKGPGF